MIEEYETFFVRYAGECIIRIFALEIHHQLCKLVSRPEKGDGVRKRLPTNDGREITMGFAMSSQEFRAGYTSRDSAELYMDAII